jgi:hypothetical protein
MVGWTFVFDLYLVSNVFFLSFNDRTFMGSGEAGFFFFLSFSLFFFFPPPLLVPHQSPSSFSIDASAVGGLEPPVPL